MVVTRETLAKEIAQNLYEYCNTSQCTYGISDGEYRYSICITACNPQMTLYKITLKDTEVDVYIKYYAVIENGTAQSIEWAALPMDKNGIQTDKAEEILKACHTLSYNKRSTVYYGDKALFQRWGKGGVAIGGVPESKEDS